MSVKVDGTTGVSLVQEPALAFVPKQNWIINGQFDVWQRGTSFGNVYDVYTADRWQGQASNSISKQSFAVGQTAVPNNPAYFVNINNATYGYSNFSQKIEDVTKLSNKTVALSFWAKSSTSSILTLYGTQNFGSGGSATVAVVVNGQNSYAIQLTPTWTRYTALLYLPSISGKTLGTSHYWTIGFFASFGTPISASIDLANVCLVEGSIPQECPNEPYVEVLRKCQRYYVKFNSPALYGAVTTAGVGTGSTTGVSQVSFPVKMRIPPTAIEYSTLAAACYNGDGAVSSLTLGTGSTTDMIGLVNVTASAIGANATYFLRQAANAAGYLAFSAEL